MLDIRPATREDAAWMGANLRAEDREEVKAATGDDPVAVLLRSLRISRECYCAFWRTSPRPCVIFGVSDDPSTPGLGVVWLLATEQIHECRRDVLRLATEWLQRLAREYPAGLHNVADARNHLHLRWCLLTGFQRLAELDVRGRPFVHIYRPNHV